MAIFFLAHHGGVGGASLSLLELVIGLRDRGLDCRIVLPRPGFLAEGCAENNVPYLIFESDQWAHLGPVGWPLRLRKLLGHSWRALKLARLLGQWNCSLLVSNSLTLCEGAMAAALRGLPHVAYIREFGDLDYGIHFEWGTQRSLGLLSRLSQRTIFNSQALADYFAGSVKPGTGRIAYNAVTVPQVAVQGSAEPAALRCLLVGSLHPGKGQLEAVQAVTRLGPSVHLDLIGPEMDLAYSRQIGQLAESCRRIRLLGTLPPAECYRQMAGADVVLMCSRMEAFGRVTVEAMKLGRAVIGAASGGTSELIEEGRTGLLYRPGDVEDLSDKIHRLDSDRSFCQRLGEQARLATQERFTRESYAEAVHTILSEVRRKNRLF